MTARQAATRGLRVLLAKMGMDGHDRGVKIVARTLRDCGHEVVYLGRRQSTPMVISTAAQEDVDVIGLSVLSGTHLSLVGELTAACRAADLDVPIVVGGTILRREIPSLVAMGVSRVFPVGSHLQEIRDYFDQLTVEINARRALTE